MARVALDGTRALLFCLDMDRMTAWPLLALLALSCSRTTPDTQWPPPGPPDGLPYIPLPQDDMFASDEAEEPAAPSAASAGPSPLDPALPEAPKVSLSRAAKCDGKQCELRGFLPAAVLPTALPKAEPTPAVMWSQSIAKGSTLIIPRHHGLECFVVVLQGELLVSGDDGGGGQSLGAWAAARAPGCGVAMRAAAADVSAVLALASTKGNLDEPLAHAKAKPWEVRWKKRPAPLATFQFSKVDDLAWAGGAFHARIAVGNVEPALPASFGLLRASRDGSVPEHDHPTWEHIAILSGRGKMMMAGAAHEVAPGACFDIPVGVKHAFISSKSEPLLAVQMYTPSGPEARFVALAKAEAAKGPAAKP
ncbi:MAG: cupin domain-containing protein [Polyangiaceae bacterium]